MSRAQRRVVSLRKRRIWLSLLGTLLGTGLVTGLVAWVEVRRNTDLGDPTEGVTASRIDSGHADLSPIRFRNVARELGVVMRHGPGGRSRTLPEDTAGGAAWGDYDGDGDWDLYLTNFAVPSAEETAPAGANALFRNDGDRFTEVAAEAGVTNSRGFGMGATFADYDDDGDVDLYVTNHGPNRLFRNRGDGTFEEIGAAAGVDDPLWSTGAAWGDFDRDGHLDLYVCNYVEYETVEADSGLLPETPFGTYTVPFTLNPNSFDPAPNRLYRNRGDGTFEDVAEICGVQNPEGRSLAATFCDLDGDGWLDLYVNNDVSANQLYRNMGGEVSSDQTPETLSGFVDLSAITGTADPRGSMGLSVGEFGGADGRPDGLPDLFVTHWVAQENALYQSLRLPGGNFEYRDKTRQFRLGEISIDTVGWGCALIDLDLDSRVDIAVANGSTLERKDDPDYLLSEPIFLFLNDGDLFHDVAPAAGEVLSRRHCARSLAAADFDADGDVDMAVAINRGQPLLLRNETRTDNQGLTVTLVGPVAACFGARVEVTAKEHRQVQWYGSDVTFLGMHAVELVFGLGRGASPASVRVRWADGRESSVDGVSAGRVAIVHPEEKRKAQETAKAIKHGI